MRTLMGCVLWCGLLAIAIGSAAPASVQAQTSRTLSAGHTDPAAFVAELARAVGQDDRTAVSALIQYPIPVRIGGLRVPFSGPDALLARYDDVFTAALRDAIGRAAGPLRAGITSSPGGLVIGTNAVTIGRVDGRLRVTAIVVPPEDVLDAVARAPAGSSASRNDVAPRRIAIRAGPRPTRLAGSLAPGGIDTYVVFVPKGQLLQVRVERVRQEAALRVVAANTGTPLNASARANTTVVSGRAQIGSDYRIEVKRVSTDETVLPYLLAVIVR